MKLSNTVVGSAKIELVVTTMVNLVPSQWGVGVLVRVFQPSKTGKLPRYKIDARQ